MHNEMRSKRERRFITLLRLMVFGLSNSVMQELKVLRPAGRALGSVAIAAQFQTELVIGRQSKGQRVELGCVGLSLGFGTVELSLLDHVHRLDAGKEDARAAKGLESHHRPRDLLDGPLVLLDDVV